MTQSSPFRGLQIVPLPFSEEIRPGDSLLEKLLGALKSSRFALKAGDILIVKHKIVSKAEGQLVELDKVKPSARSREIGRASCRERV
jgi:coenzyme F420-0:L-glutamate ligase / coenzyme F420-1:gamma-L-glutamate ligase